MNIIHVISKLSAAGAEIVALNLAIEQAKSHSVTIITVCSHNEEDNDVVEKQKSELKKSNIRVIEIPTKKFQVTFPITAYKLVKHIKHIGPDIVHSHTDWPDICVSLAKRLFDFNVVRTIHSSKLWATWWLPGYISESGYKSDAVVFIGKDTELAYKSLRKKYKLGCAELQVTIPNGVRVPSPSKFFNRDDFVIKHYEGESELILGYFGRLSVEKGIDILIDSMKDLSSLNIVLHVFGSGHLMAELKDKVKDTKVSVVFHGSVASAPAYMAAMDIVVMPSRFEGLPLVSLESQMVGTPVLISDAQGIRESVVSCWPLKFESENREALTQMLHKVYQNQFDLARLSEKSKDWVSQFNIESMAESYNTVYEQLIDLNNRNDAQFPY